VALAASIPCVLVVDDDETIRTTVAEALEFEGYAVASATNGAEALELVRQQRPQAIVLDLMMPVMSGWEFLDACGDELLAAGIPVAVATAAHAPGAVASRPTVSAVLSKPFDLDVLEAIVHRLTARRRTAGDAA
jgi:CheY-like chemotaxis protein